MLPTAQFELPQYLQTQIQFPNLPWILVFYMLAQTFLYFSLGVLALAAAYGILAVASAILRGDRWPRIQARGSTAEPRRAGAETRKRSGRGRAAPGPREYDDVEYPAVGSVDLTPADAEEP